MAKAGEILKKTGTRAAEGAAIGSVIPGVGTGIGAAAGGIEGFIESLFSSSDDGGQGAVDAAGAEKMRRMQEADKILMAQREKRQQTQMNALANRMGAYQGANNVLASMYGPLGSMAPGLSLNAGGKPSMMGGPQGPLDEPGKYAGYRAGSSAPTVAQPPSIPTSGEHAPPGPGYTWTSQGTQGGGAWRPPSLSPAISQIASQMSAPAPTPSVRPPLRRAV